jgi:hypothetical protein
MDSKKDRITILKEEMATIRRLISPNTGSGEEEPRELMIIREYKFPTTQIKYAQTLISEVYDFLPKERKQKLNVLLLSNQRGEKKKFWKTLKEEYKKKDDKTK